jgi:hypothetical protein
MKTSACAYKIGSKAYRGLNPGRLRGEAMYAFALSIALASVAHAQSPRSPISVECTNPYSGVHWTIKIDYDQHTVDSNPARIDDSTISWRDSANGWYYELDRKTGNLTVTVASATGGNFLHDQCTLVH